MRIRGLGDLGHFGVLLFFVHTSLVLMLSMRRLGLSGSRLYVAFMVRRIFRIYPLSVFIVLLVVALHIPFAPWFVGEMGRFVWPGWPGLFSNIFLIQNITHRQSVLNVLWSLPFEVQMYAALPLLYLLMRRFPSFWAAWFAWLAAVSVAGLEYALLSARGNYDFLLLRYFPCFLAGVVAWRLISTQRRRLRGSLWMLFLLVLVALYRLEDVFRVYGPNWLGALHGQLRNDHRIYLPPYIDLVRDWVFCGITGLAIPFFVDLKSRWLNAMTKRIAQYSYGIYLSHVPIFWLCFVKLHLGSVAAGAALSIFLTALVSLALYHWLEDPAIRMGKRVAARLSQRTTLQIQEEVA